MRERDRKTEREGEREREREKERERERERVHWDERWARDKMRRRRMGGLGATACRLSDAAVKKLESILIHLITG